MVEGVSIAYNALLRDEYRELVLFFGTQRSHSLIDVKFNCSDAARLLAAETVVPPEFEVVRRDRDGL
jgi:hypothetical protein